MRVISKTRDFYDTAGYIDRSVVFLRKEEEEKPATISHPHSYGRSSEGLLGFCGKFYPYIHRTIEHKHHITGITIDTQHFYYYSFEDYKKTKFWRAESTRRYYSRKSSEEEYVNFFSHWNDSDELFVKFDAPYFKVKTFTSEYDRNHGKTGLVITNPSLVDMQFGKVMSAFDTFQAINFYLTNQLVKVKDPDEIEDKYRIAQHGYDKFSFRHPVKLKDLK